MTINKLPDELLLESFDFYKAYSSLLSPFDDDAVAWHTLVHVCRRWRHVVFGSPCRLGLRLFCVNKRLVKVLDIWSELPIIIRIDDAKIYQHPSVTNVISVLKRHNQVCKILTHQVPNSFLKEVATMSGHFPALIELKIVASFDQDRTILQISDSFLGGYVPRLRSLSLSGFSFPAIGKLILSTRDLVYLSLQNSPDSGYIPPEAMVDILSALTRLQSLYLNVNIPRYLTHDASRRSPALTRIVLPALTHFDYWGHSKYLEVIVSRIDAPLNYIDVAFYDEVVFSFDSRLPLLRDFIDRTQILDAPDNLKAYTTFSSFEAKISFLQRKALGSKVLILKMIFYPQEPQFWLLAQTLSWLLPPLSNLEYLHIRIEDEADEDQSEEWHHWHEVGNAEWIELLRPFVSVKDLVIDEQFVLTLASVLQELVEEQLTEILPALQNIILKGFKSSSPVPEGIGEFIAARELSGRPVVVHHGRKKR